MVKTSFGINHNERTQYTIKRINSIYNKHKEKMIIKWLTLLVKDKKAKINSPELNFKKRYN